MDLNTPQGMLREDADAMYLTLRFDYSTDTLYVPDGYIGDLRTFQAGFLDWLYHTIRIICSAMRRGMPCITTTRPLF